MNRPLHAALASLLTLATCGCCTSGGVRPTQDLVLFSARSETNGFPLNPVWRDIAAPQTLNAGLCPDPNPCGALEVSDPPVWTRALPFICKDTGDGPRDGKAAGHLWYGIGTFWGTVAYETHSPDDDLNFGFRLDAGGLGMVANEDAHNAHLEFRLGETVRHFRSPRWEDFARPGTAHRRAMFDGKTAVTVAMVALDCVHCYAVELHPVFAFAVRADARDLPDAREETWLLFARPVAGAGECAEKAAALEGLDGGRVSIPLPWPDAAARPVVQVVAHGLFGTRGFYAADEVVRVTPDAPNGWVAISIPTHLDPDPSIAKWSRVSGEIVLRYGATATREAPRVLPLSSSRSAEKAERAMFTSALSTADDDHKDSREGLRKKLAKLRRTDPKAYAAITDRLYLEDTSWYDTPHDEVPLLVEETAPRAGVSPLGAPRTAAPRARSVPVVFPAVAPD